MALRQSALYSFITSQEGEVKLKGRDSLPEEPWSPASIVLTKEAVNYFAGNSCKTSVNVHDVEGCGFQMGSPASWLISGKRGWPVQSSCEMGILLGKLMAVGGLHRCLEGSLGALLFWISTRPWAGSAITKNLGDLCS